jgi:hypothetical protein
MDCKNCRKRFTDAEIFWSGVVTGAIALVVALYKMNVL